MVCPTCYCSNSHDQTSLDGASTERWQEWDSCFNGDFSYVHGGRIRGSIASRYRQWLTHKLSSWHEQFGRSGCVGCGRCVTWCPVGIDIVEEAGRIRG
jgi:ferredoxin